MKEITSAESAIHVRGKFDENEPAGLTRAFSALVSGQSDSWGDAPAVLCVTNCFFMGVVR